MSIGCSNLGSLADTTARSAYTCALSRAPADNALALVAVLASASAGNPVQPNGVVGAGLTFSLITSSITFDPLTVGSQLLNLSLWRGMGSGLVNSPITASFDLTGTGCAMVVDEVTGVATSGANGSDAVGGSASSAPNGSVSAITTFLPSAASTANAWYSCCGAAITTSIDTPGQNWTKLSLVTYASPTAGLESAFTTKSGGTLVTWVGETTNHNRAALAIELVAIIPSSGSTSSPPSTSTPAGNTGNRRRLAPVPSTWTGQLRPVASLLNLWFQQLNNNEAYISIFSAANPNTSGLTGLPGNLAVNVGSASSWTRLWVMGGSTASLSTSSWHAVRVG